MARKANAGSNLRQLRNKAGLSIKAAHKLSQRLATVLRNPQMALTPRLISAIEQKKHIPNVYRVYALSTIYECTVREILSYYGVSCDKTDQLRAAWEARKS